MAAKLKSIPVVDIDCDGVFKYILVHLCAYDPKDNKVLVRGYARAKWHSDIFKEVETKVKEIVKGVDVRCLGGGKIDHERDYKQIKVFGTSQKYGKADHRQTVQLLKVKYPDYKVCFSDEET
ncbi:14 kDa phosphohistidine phosphatase-like [Ctenocephalides felis]|uniref:14 kDa phosphohistidine phosphatase-like n=1 Tax=Ctenocephalides felis TaxID=7515 RepID=UPI000E6E3423|nr:14 kDa phosphohistidine phosphatase-like [Ctenocephalides felis]